MRTLRLDPTRPRSPTYPMVRRHAGFTLVETVIALSLVALLCLAVIGGLQTLSRLALGTAIRAEGHRLLQAEAERLCAVDFASFVASSEQTLTSNFKTSFRPSAEAPLALPSDNSGRVSFVRRVIETDATTSTRTLRVEVQWTWQGQPNLISAPLHRSQ